MPYAAVVVNIGGGNVRREQLEGRTHVVVPAAILPREGILVGSEGKAFYSEEEVEDSLPTWDHRPIVMRHPQKGREFVSANDSRILNAQKVGLTLNTTIDDKVRTECWIDEERANKIDKRLITNLDAGKMVEVSSGFKHKSVKEDGEYNGEKYTLKVRGIKGDHLAALLDEKGAYSIERGGGMLVVNRATDPPRVATIRKKSRGYLKKLTAVLGDMRKIFQPVAAEIAAKLKESKNMAFDKKAHIDGLIQAKMYTEADRAGLESVPDAILSKVEAPAPAAATVVAANASGGDGAGGNNGAQNGTPAVTPAVTPASGAKAQTLNDLIANAGGEQSEAGKMLRRMGNVFVKQRNKNIQAIKDGTKRFTDQVLANMDDDTLEALAEEFGDRQQQAAGAPYGGFFGAAGTVVANAGQDDAPLGMPEYETTPAAK